MSVVSVSKESLQRVKTALREFQTNVETSTEHIKSHAEEIVTSTRSSIKKQHALVESLENKVALLSSEIEQCQAQIICNSNQINSLKDNIADVSLRVSNLDGRIVQLDMQKQRLSASSSSADHCNDNSNQIYAIEHQIQSCENHRRQLDNQLSSMRNQENSLNCQNAKRHTEKSRMDATLIMTKKELKEACEKSEEMKNAGAAVESSISNFLIVALQYRQTAILTSNTNKSGIDKCIAAIEEYAATNLNSTVHLDSDTSDVVKNFRGQLIGVSEFESSQKAKMSFCGNMWVKLPTSDSTWTIPGKHYLEYVDLLQNGDSCFFEDLQDSNKDYVVMISPLDIEGVHLSDYDIADPRQFWNRGQDNDTDSEVFFANAASLISEVSDRLQSGESPESLSNDSIVGHCYDLYFSHPLNVVDCGGYYEFSGDGRHRYLAARTAGCNIPVHVYSRRINR